MENKRRIVVYEDPQAMTAAAELVERLKESFPSYRVDGLPTAAFLRALETDAGAIAVIPGIFGDDCRYTDLLGGEAGHKKINDYVARGGVLLTVCAGSYFVTLRTEWQPHWGPAKARENLRALFNGVARGPVGPGRQATGAPHSYSDCTMIQVRYKSADGAWRETEIAYGNGPALYPDEDQPGLEVLARYNGVAGNPAAAAWLKHGRGAVLWLGVLPYMGFRRTAADNDSALAAKYRDFMESLRGSEDGRRDFWAALVERINGHLAAACREPPAPDQRRLEL